MQATDPLANLRDIHLGDPISSFPALGWWLLLGLVLLMLAGLALFFWRRYQQRAYWREALALLDALEKNHSGRNDPETQKQLVFEISKLLKRVSITRYGRERVASLTGNSWLEFLDETGDTHEFSQGAGQALGEALYRQDTQVDPDSLLTLTRDWLQKQK